MRLRLFRWAESMRSLLIREPTFERQAHPSSAISQPRAAGPTFRTLANRIWRGRTAVHFVFVSSENLRELENELADGIIGELPGWAHSRRICETERGAVNVTFFVPRRAHVMMSHGVADKNYLLRRDLAGGLELNKFRIVCVPGHWMQRKLAGNPEVTIPPDKIRIVGWPRLDRLLAAQRNLPPTEPGRKPKVLWAPTHPGRADKTAELSSYPKLNRYLDRMQEVFDLDVSLHPANRGGGRPTFEKLLEAEYVIADRGTTIYEAWALGKPVIFPRWILGDHPIVQTPGSAEAEIYEKKIGIHVYKFKHLVDAVMSRPRLTDDVSAFVEDYLPRSTHGKSYKLIADCVRDIWESGDLKVGAKAKAPPR